jgi:hypothetical protein
MILGFRLMRSGSSFIVVSRLFILCALLLCSCLVSSLFMITSCRHRLSPITTTALACCCFATLGDPLIVRAVGFAMGVSCALIALSAARPVAIDSGCAAEFITTGLLAV